jgi:ribonuclease-3
VTFPKDQETIRAPEVSPERKKDLQLFEKNAGIRFRRQDLLNLAFSHRSFANESGCDIANNEKLEFLGDSVLGLVVAEYLYRLLPGEAEGRLAKIKSFVVSEDSLADIARRLSVDSCILIGKGEEHSGGREKKALLADAMEAVIGALYLDSGFKTVSKFILRYFVPEIEKVLEDRHRKDYKTLLQEYLQKTHKVYPRYILAKKTGPDHAKVFWMEVQVLDRRFGPGKGRNKKEPEQRAAEAAYRYLQDGGASGSS